MTICNACRYCEGLLRRVPGDGAAPRCSARPISTIWPTCATTARECYYACQYAPPHEFAVNVPQVFAEIRAQSYRKYAWPQYRAGRAHGWRWRSGLIVIAILLAGGRSATGANFYGVISHEAMVATFGVVAAFIFVAQVMGLLRFWGIRREAGPIRPRRVCLQAARDVLSL